MAKSKTYTPHTVNAYGTDMGIVYYGELELPGGLAEKFLKEKTELLIQVLGDKTVRAQLTETLDEGERGARRVRFEGREGFWSAETLKAD